MHTYKQFTYLHTQRMKQLTRQEVEAVVESIQKHACSHRCCVVCGKRNISIGNVLFWMQNITLEHEDDETFGMHCKILCLLWEPLIFTNSLQEIVESSGWSYTLNAQEEDSSIRRIEVLTSPEANALFNFLQEIL